MLSSIFFKDFPIWNFDGSSTGQACSGQDSDTYLKPVAYYADPFLGGNNKLVLCETYDREMKPTGSFKLTQLQLAWFNVNKQLDLL